MKTKHINIIRIKAVLVVVALVSTVSIEAKRFYDTKSNLIGITGNIDILCSGLFNEQNKFVANEVPLDNAVVYGSGGFIDPRATERSLNQKNIGKKILDYLFMRTADGKMSEDLLKERALKNAQLADFENAKAGLIDASTIVREDYINILKNNYIFVAKKYERGDVYFDWALYHVEIDEKIQEDVFASWDDPSRYDAINVKVTLIGNNHKTKQKTYNNVLRKVSMCDPALAIRGSVLHNPYRTEVGYIDGLKGDDRLFIYRQNQSADGTYYSTRIGRARVTSGDKHLSHMSGISGRTGSEKKGDFAVLNPDANWGHSIYYGIKGHNISYGYLTEIPLHLSILPLCDNFIVRASFGEFMNGEDKLYLMGDHLYHSPHTYELHGGCSGRYYMLNRLTLMPYYTIGYSMMNFKGYNGPDGELGLFSATAGIRAAVNIWYPLQAMAGAEYQFRIPLNSKDSNNNYLPWEMVKVNFFDRNDWKFNDLNIYFGLRVVL